MAKVSIIGAGSWGTAIGILLANKGEEVVLCAMSDKKYDQLMEKHENVTALPGVPLPKSIHISQDIEESISGADVLVMAVASIYTREIARKISPFVREDQIIVVVSKGIEEDTLLTLEEVVEEEVPQARIAILSGPSHAEEVGRSIPTTCVIGARKKETAVYLQSVFMSDSFRVYINPDMLGIALGGALKNVIALAAGIADGLGYGDNTKAALITRGIAEISRLGDKMGAVMATFAGLSGIGDLIVTCASLHSRNRRAGLLIGQGRTPKEAMEEVQMVVEGVYAARSALKLADKYGVDMPIVKEVNQVLFEGKDPAQAVRDLMLRDNIVEVKNIPWPEDEDK
ncbi:MAG: NAD(P)-dependent glycerol-3-phosphate dehydrogenase [Clostridiales bacterium]|nr:NAD(P)-dependent glycerol-3-phosphate dehydrogenase [Clostridiales bacterium]MBS5877127.1 NAD(P)-dependent glycerol-3-phosphate dehydrogenase [Clostridiales bacterium]MDU0939032.1 NAD(P)H-dependent glycerol-3-phosphate dehydrogenase [Clostridiales bacterium]MDU1041833.1 NAD(P)H-dependent glycerol-3-phosphate dehydrogenase [Clostridiales bacterium]MDU3490582.1 NAD(P)H-dependent glycerol-3-phosphate dehydrogenase [Clostridiales bacterium]